MSITAATTELEAINIMLAAIGEAPVNKLTGTLPVDVKIAQNLLNEQSKSVQGEGWSFNTEYNVVLTRSANNKINLPANVLKVDVNIHDHPQVDAVQRGLKLYDRFKHTDIFDEDLKCEVLYFLKFEELPEPARRYINIKAARVFVDRAVTDESLRTYTQQDETRARAILLDSDNENNDTNMLIGDPALTGRLNTFNPSSALIRD
tara:strand:- start:32156 stop:32770 length:615 start_codon:yes stop_codon:yes gene_type:complete